MAAIGKDKWMHAWVCTAVAAVIGLAALPCSAPALAVFVSGFLGAMACGAGKEYGDSKAKGNCWIWGDIAADAAGALTGSALATGIAIL